MNKAKEGMNEAKVWKRNERKEGRKELREKEKGVKKEEAKEGRKERSHENKEVKTEWRKEERKPKKEKKEGRQGRKKGINYEMNIRYSHLEGTRGGFEFEMIFDVRA